MNCDNRTSGKLAMALQHGARVLFESEKQDTNGPGVTVAVTLYNYAQYIEGALDSVFKQTHSNIELIVVDDASQDGSQIVARRWMEKNAARFTRIRLLAYDGNCGLAQARNTAFANATNDYVFVLDSDNEIHPDAIAKLLAACVSENAEVAYSLIEKFGDATGIFGEVWNPSNFRIGNYIDAMALVRKSAWHRAGGYTQPSEIQGWEDYDLWCKFVELGFRGVLVPEVLCRYRVHQSSMLHVVSDPKNDRIRLAMMKRHPWLRLVATLPARDKIGAWLRYCRIVGLKEAMKTALRDFRNSVARRLKTWFRSAPPTRP